MTRPDPWHSPARQGARDAIRLAWARAAVANPQARTLTQLGHAAIILCGLTTDLAEAQRALDTLQSETLRHGKRIA